MVHANPLDEDTWIILTDDDAKASRIPEGNYKFQPKDGKQRYPAGIEVFHQLHCLVCLISSLNAAILSNECTQNLLRKTVWFNFDYYKTEGKEEFEYFDTLQVHVGEFLSRVPFIS
jgi:Mycotoxin biosynthesis protein UstYa